MAKETFKGRIMKIASAYTDLTRRSDRKWDWYPQIPETFFSIKQYVSVFTPFLFEECCALMKQKDIDESFSCYISRGTNTSIQNEYKTISLAKITSDDLRQHFFEKDVTLLRKCKYNERSKVNNEESKSSFRKLGIINMTRGVTEFDCKFFFENTKKNPMNRGFFKDILLQKGFSQNTSCWYITKLCSLSTTNREYVALKCLKFTPFSKIILQGFNRDDETRISQTPCDDYCGTLYAYNDQQTEAILLSNTKSKLILIQGPPGTGKTSTILGVIHQLFFSHLNPPPKSFSDMNIRKIGTNNKISIIWNNIPWVQTHIKKSVKSYFSSDKSNEKRNGKKFFNFMSKHMLSSICDLPTQIHILLCAPSNSALDEVLMRLLCTGSTFKRATAFTPKVIRVGLTIHHSVAHIDIEKLYVDISKKLKKGGVNQKVKITRSDLIDKADIVATTLSFSGSNIFETIKKPFDILVVDEAAQATELSTLIPLRLGVNQIFMIGDPSQLPATVLSSTCIKNGYNISLMHRLMKTGYKVQKLTIQYRMHPVIREFPSGAFYGGILRDGPNAQTNRKEHWHRYSCFGPLVFYDVRGYEDKFSGSHTLFNIREAQLVIAIYLYLVGRYSYLRDSKFCGILSPYKGQVKLIRRKFSQIIKSPIVAQNLLDINTIDGFQGREKDIIIFSTVRALKNKSDKKIGFVADDKRVNVALTRARSSLILVGHAASLSSNRLWQSLVRHCSTAGNLFKLYESHKTVQN
jgi:senataxin